MLLQLLLLLGYLRIELLHHCIEPLDLLSQAVILVLPADLVLLFDLLDEHLVLVLDLPVLGLLPDDLFLLVADDELLVSDDVLAPGVLLPQGVQLDVLLLHHALVKVVVGTVELHGHLQPRGLHLLLSHRVSQLLLPHHRLHLQLRLPDLPRKGPVLGLGNTQPLPQLGDAYAVPLLKVDPLPLGHLEIPLQLLYLLLQQPYLPTMLIAAPMGTLPLELLVDLMQSLILYSQHQYLLNEVLLIAFPIRPHRIIDPRLVHEVYGGAKGGALFRFVELPRGGRDVDGAVDRLGEHVVRECLAGVHGLLLLF